MELAFSIILFLAAFIPGFIILRLGKPLKLDLKYLLVFAGAFIFSITIVHLLPELFTAASNPQMVGLFVLLGFFMQIFLDFLTTGVEHGHLHKHEHHGGFSPYMLMIGLCIHAVMDGSILVHSGDQATDEHGTGLLVGILLHKIPAAIALVTVLNSHLKNKKYIVVLLLIFSLSSPAGLMFSEVLSQNNLITQQGFIMIFAIVSGNLLHISTTIYFESSPDHTFHKKKIFISLLGALLAIFVEVLNH